MNENNLIEQIHQLDEKLTSSVEHKKREAKFAEEANIRFENNMSAFSKYFPDIAKVLSTYQVRDDFCLHVTPSDTETFYPKDVAHLCMEMTR
ncbi:hypothetical protein [Pseudoalteromonas xiamenensis]